MHLNLKLSRIFYGWWVVVACFLNALLVGGFVIFGFTAFFEPIASGFGWSYTQISLAASLRGAEVGLLAPLLGLFVDRWGPRRLMFGGIVLLGLGLILLSRTTSLGMFYGAFAVVAMGTSGLSPTVVMTAVANWFRRKVGLATGIMASGFAFGSLLVPVVVRLIDVFDWQTAIFILGVGIWVIGLPLSLLLRHKPEQYGYLPDGEQSNTAIPYEGLTPAQTVEVDIGAKQALKSRAFWHVGLAMAFQFLSISAVIIHVMPYLSKVGIARLTSGLVATAVPLTSIIGRLGSGWLGDRFDKRRVAIGCFAVMSLGLLFFSYASDQGMWLLVPFIILFGIGWGGNVTLRAALLREYFGRRAFGTILGFMMGMIALGGILGPLFAGWVFDNQGSYHVAWLVLACLVFAGLIIMATAPPAGTSVQLADKRNLSRTRSG